MQDEGIFESDAKPLPVFNLELGAEKYTVGEKAQARISMDWTQMGYEQPGQSEVGWFVKSCVLSGAGRQIALIGSGEETTQNDKCWLDDPFDSLGSNTFLPYNYQLPVLTPFRGWSTSKMMQLILPKMMQAIYCPYILAKS